MARGKRVTLILGEAAALGTDHLQPNESGSGRTPAAQERRLRIAAFLVGKQLDGQFTSLVGAENIDEAIQLLKQQVTTRNFDLNHFDRREILAIYSLLIERRYEVEAVLARFSADQDIFTLDDPDVPDFVAHSPSGAIQSILARAEWTEVDVKAIANDLWQTEHGPKILEYSKSPGESIFVVKTYILTDLVPLNEGYRKLTEGENSTILVNALIACEKAMTKRD